LQATCAREEVNLEAWIEGGADGTHPPYLQKIFENDSEI
jgi:hypothetical protein